MKRHQPIIEGFEHFIHGGDYNGEQWKDTPEIFDEDFRLMNLCGFNSLTLGIFAWSELEPTEGSFDFSYLDEIMERLARSGRKAVLATPSASRPHWLAEKYPEVLRVAANGVRNRYSRRHNHCMTSPVYREKTRIINEKIAERYKNHSALGIWHISNEYSGECFCDKCVKAFREWLSRRYDNDIEKLNYQYWSAFWSHKYNSFEQIEPPYENGEREMSGLVLDWKRFVTYQTADFMVNEINAVKKHTPKIPVTTNLMGFFQGIDSRYLSKFIDVAAWDSYPAWHSGDNISTAVSAAMTHDLTRGLKQKPFMLMESTPSVVNWAAVNKLKRPNMHMLSSLQAIAHGADTVQYFQWRKSRGSNEQWHGAVVDHCGHENTRVFGEVARLGQALEKLDDAVGAGIASDVAIIYDWDNNWALDLAQGFKKPQKVYETLACHYAGFWKRGVNVDIIGRDDDYEKYKLIIAPQMFIVTESSAAKIKSYVKNGGVFVGTYMLGMINENALAHLGGAPFGELKEVFGIWNEEADALYDGEFNMVSYGGRDYEAIDICERVHSVGGEVIAEYKRDFYRGEPAICKNSYGGGTAYYIAFRSRGDFEESFYADLIDRLKIKRALDVKLPDGVTAHTRECGDKRFVFVGNYSENAAEIALDKEYTDVLSGEEIKSLLLPPYGSTVLV